MAAACPHEQGGDGKRVAVRVMKCDACAGRHQETLRAAGCGATEVQSWCSAADGTELRPFTAHLHARDALRKLRPLPEGGATVLLHAGVYGPLALDARLDSGTEGAPITYAAFGDGPAVLSGGVHVPTSAFVPWAGRSGVYRASLAPLGITTAQLGSMNQSGAGLVNGCVNRKSVLTLGPKRMTLARYPNKDTSGIENRVMKSNGGGRFYLIVNATQEANMSRVATWATQPDAYIHGWFSFDWTDGYRRLVSATMNAQHTSLNVTLQQEHGGDVQESLQLAKRGARFYGMNMLSELDHEEEYYINASERALYFMPPAASFSDEGASSPLLGDAAAVLSINDTVLNITGARWLHLSGLTIAHSTGNGVEANGAQHITIENCTVGGTGQHGINLQNVLDIHMNNSTIRDIGCRGITITAGNALTLVSGNSSFTNLHIHHTAQWKRTYQAGIEYSGVDCDFINNTITVSNFLSCPSVRF